MNQNNFEYKNDNKMGKNTMDNEYMEAGAGVGGYGSGMCNMCPPIQECPQERVCHRVICYEVPQE